MNDKYNIVDKKNYFLLIFFVILLVLALLRILDNALQLDAWQYGEWLINYQHGFVRRGLIGEVIYLISKIFNNNFQITFIIIISTVVLFYYYLNYQLLKNIKHNFVTYLIIFSPLFYLFFIVISKIGIKKELILYIYYLVYLISLSSVNFKIKKNWKFIIIFPFLLLNHEGHFFYLPYVIAPLLFLIKKKELKILLYQTILLLIISSITMVLLFYFKGTGEHTLIICESLKQYRPAKCDWWGPIAGLKTDISISKVGSYLESNITNKSIIDGNYYFYIFNEPLTYLKFIFYISYAFFPLYLFLKFFNFRRNYLFNDRKNYLLIYLIIFTFSLPLFHLAEDWSRWFSIHFHLTALLIFFSIKKGIVYVKKKTNFEKINKFLINKKNIKYFILCLFLYSTMFHHHHFFWKGVKLKFTYYKVFKNITNNY
jgi:hypothetical protein